MRDNHYFSRGALLMGAAFFAPAVQTSYADRMPVGFPGMIVNETEYNIDTRIVETVLGIGFGLAVSQGVADKGALLGGAAVANFVGISVRDVTLDVTAADKYPQYVNMAVLTMGDIWVTTGGAVVAGDQVTFAAATGVLSSIAAGGANFAIAGARWMTSAASGALAVVRLTGSLPSA